MSPKQISLTFLGCLLVAGSLFYGSNRPVQPDTIITPATGSDGTTEQAAPTISAGTPTPSIENPAPTGSTGESDSISKNASSPSPAPSQHPPLHPHPQPSGVSSQSTAGESENPPEPVAADTVPAQPPVGLRLAPDVRLPVAAMPIDFKISPVAKEALEQIVIDYYNDLAAGLSGREPGEDTAGEADPIETSENGEPTRIVTNSPIADQARKRADYRFKALFGNAAYNRMTMNTLLEARLPQQSVAD